VTEHYYQHPWGVWRETANLVVHLVTEDEDSITTEQIWLRQEPELPQDHAVLCCLPFFAYGYALGDIVQFDLESFTVVRRVTPSGRSLLRVYFCQSEGGEAIIQRLLLNGCANVERMSDSLACLDFESRSSVEKCWAILSQLEELGDLHLETGSLGYLP
jgi:Domain of unknown function (DUF4265)